MDAAILRALLLLTLAVASVLMARRPLRQSFDAGPAFTLWLLPPLLAALSWLPAMPVDWLMLPTIHVLPGHPVGTNAPGHASSTVSWLGATWLAGAILGLLRLLVHYASLHRHGRSLPKPMLAALLRETATLDRRRLRLHRAGPAVLWAPRSLVLLPPDFMQRFSAGERQLILRHELAHLNHGDLLWNLLAELVAALLWFHPLIWLTLPRFRLDQELA